MSRTLKFISNAASSLFLQVVTLVSGLIIPRLMLVTYGSEINGLVASISQFVRYFALVEAGLASASIVALYKPLADKDHFAINGIVSATRIYYFRSGYIFVALVLGCSLLYPCFIKTEYLSFWQVGLLVLVIGCSGVLNFFAMAKYQALVTADQKLYILNYLNIISVVISTVMICCLTRLDVNIVTLRIAALVSIILPPIVMHFYIRKYYSYVDYRVKPNNNALHKRWDAFILQILGLVNTSAPFILITLFASLTEVSVFAIYSMVVMGIMQVLSIFGTGMFSSFGELIAQGDMATLRKAYNEYEFMIYSIMALFYSCSMVLLLPFIKLYTRGITDANYYRPLIGFLFVLNALLYSIKSPQGTLVSSAGLFKETKYQTLAQALIAIFLGVILTIHFGIGGVLIAFIVSNTYRDIDLIIFIPKKLNNTRIITTLKRVGLVFIEFAMICLPFVYFNMNAASYLKWLANGIIVFIYGSIVIVLISLIFDREVLYATVKRLSIVVKRTCFGR